MNWVTCRFCQGNKPDSLSVAHYLPLSPIQKWDLQRICYGFAAKLGESEELRVKSEEFELVPLALGMFAEWGSALFVLQ